MSYLDVLPQEFICIICDHLKYLYDIDNLLDVYDIVTNRNKKRILLKSYMCTHYKYYLSR